MRHYQNEDERVNTRIVDALLGFHYAMSNIDNKPLNYNTEYQVYRSEIHMIDFIGRNPDLSITEISENMGMTRSAASQLISRLCKRNFASKIRVKKEVRVTLTELGHRLFLNHIEFHQQQDYHSVFQNVEKYSLEIRELIADFIIEYNRDVPKR